MYFFSAGDFTERSPAVVAKVLSSQALEKSKKFHEII
jgi:hypothetical protein